MTLNDIQCVIDDAESKGTHIGCSPRFLRALLKIAWAAESFTTCACEFHDQPDACSENLDALILAQDELEALEIP